MFPFSQLVNPGLSSRQFVQSSGGFNENVEKSFYHLRDKIDQLESNLLTAQSLLSHLGFKQATLSDDGVKDDGSVV